MGGIVSGLEHGIAIIAQMHLAMSMEGVMTELLLALTNTRELLTNLAWVGRPLRKGT
jgi:hypothetical protein